MSIRLLTAGLGIEAEETRRQQQYNVVREPQNDPIPPEPSFLSGSGKRSVKPTPPPQTSPPPRQVSLKARSTNNPWGIPGGIAARFGQDALQGQKENVEPKEIEEQQETPKLTLQEPVQELTEEQTNEETNETAEQTSEQDENARITIELQSSH